MTAHDAAPTWFGADWNPEQWDRATWREDVALMVRAGVNLATVGVFSWSSLEPRPGELTLDWLVDVLDLLHEHGIAADLATPTASPPPWLGVRWPETRAVTDTGVRLSHGSRNHFCPSSPVYRERCRAIVAALLDRCAGHPAVALWHVGNEYGQTCHCDLCAVAFRGWLAERYGDLATLNRAWGTAVWSQGHADWEEVIPPRAAPYVHNPAQRLDFRRWTSDAQLELYLEQKTLIREADPTTPVTTNAMGFFPGIDYRRWAPHLDVVSDDSYPDPADPGSVVGSAMTADLMRGLAGEREWMLMEQAWSAVSWREHNVAKTPARMRREAFQALARGAVGLCWFQWRQAADGPERFHSALLPATGPDTRQHRAVRELGAEVARLGPWRGRTRAEVCLVFDWPSWWAGTERGLPSARLDPLEQLRRWYAACWSAGVTVDLRGVEDDLSGYPVVLAPSAFLLEPAAVAGLRERVAAGAHLLLGPFSGVVDASSRIQPAPLPAGLAELLGARVEEWLPLPEPVALRPGPDADLAGGTASTWAEWLSADGAEVWLTFDGGPADGGPALVSRACGAGRVSYLACVPDQELLSRWLLGCLRTAGVAVPEDHPQGVEVVRRGEDLVVLNHTAEPRGLPLARPATDRLTGRRHEGAVPLDPDAVCVLTEEDS